MNILITGGCGYKGSKLIPALIKEGHKITNIDTQWFGNYLEEHPSLINIKSDIAQIKQTRKTNCFLRPCSMTNIF